MMEWSDTVSDREHGGEVCPGSERKHDGWSVLVMR